MLFFRLSFNESIDHCVIGKYSVTNIIREYRDNYSISCKTMMIRILLYLLNYGGFYMLCDPLIQYMGDLPLVAYFLKNAFYSSTAYVAALLTLTAQFFFISMAWLFFRPFMALVLLLIAISIGASFVYLPYGEDGLSMEEVQKLYAQ